ncbi:MAG: polysaccharide deacetylase family protein [Crocinitomicaceae bacterium]
MKLTKVPNWIRKVKSGRIWDFSVTKKEVFLTFDDGPQPEVTDWVLDLLLKHEIKATFFCVGANVRKHPEIYARMLNEGHAIGNHTFSHQNAWKASKKEYLEDIQKASELIESKLFRPPYGKISNALVKDIKEMGNEVIMWSILSYDFKTNLNTESQLKILKRKTSPGSILVFHDSMKSFHNLKKMLPSFIEYGKTQGWDFKRIELQ